MLTKDLSRCLENINDVMLISVCSAHTLLAAICIGPSIICEWCCLGAERCLWKLARLDGGEDPAPGLRPRASFNEMI